MKTDQSKLLPSFRTKAKSSQQSAGSRANRAAVKPANFSASRLPQKVQKLLRVRDRDTGEHGTVIGRRGKGKSSFLKVRWDNRDKSTLIKPDQLAVVKNKGKGERGRGKKAGHRFEFKLGGRIQANPGLLEILQHGANAAVLFGGAVQAHHILKGSKKKRKPTAHAAGKRLRAERKNGPKSWKAEASQLSWATHPHHADYESGYMDACRGRRKLKNKPRAYGIGYRAGKVFRDAERKGEINYDDEENPNYISAQSHEFAIRKIEKEIRFLKKDEGGSSLVDHSRRIANLRAELKVLRAAIKRAQRVASSGQKNSRLETRNSKPSAALQRLHQDFRGVEHSGKVLKLYIAGQVKNGKWVTDQPLKNDTLAPLIRLEMANGSDQKFAVGAAYLGGTEHGAGRGSVRRLRIGLRQPFPIPNGFNPGQIIDLGEVKKVWYKVAKPHLYPGLGVIKFHHTLGEEGGRRPHLMMQNGRLFFKGGDYEILREGIAN